jgi:hypothetical protein
VIATGHNSPACTLKIGFKKINKFHTSTSRVWHTIFTLLKEKGEEGQTKKIICKKNGKKEKQVTGVHRQTQERIEKIFFGFCDFILFFGFLG